LSGLVDGLLIDRQRALSPGGSGKQIPAR